MITFSLVIEDERNLVKEKQNLFFFDMLIFDVQGGFILVEEQINSSSLHQGKISLVILLPVSTVLNKDCRIKKKQKPGCILEIEEPLEFCPHKFTSRDFYF